MRDYTKEKDCWSVRSVDKTLMKVNVSRIIKKATMVLVKIELMAMKHFQ
jgi:hypothetical protein